MHRSPFFTMGGRNCKFEIRYRNCEITTVTCSVTETQRGAVGVSRNGNEIWQRKNETNLKRKPCTHYWLMAESGKWMCGIARARNAKTMLSKLANRTKTRNALKNLGCIKPTVRVCLKLRSRDNKFVLLEKNGGPLCALLKRNTMLKRYTPELDMDPVLLAQPDPIQSNPWMDPVHVQLWCTLFDCHRMTKSFMGRCRVQLYPTEIILPVWFKTSFWSFQTMLNFSLFCKWESSFIVLLCTVAVYH